MHHPTERAGRGTRIALLAGFALLILGVAGLSAWRGRDAITATTPTATARTDAPIGVAVADEGDTHVTEDEGTAYRRSPPASGMHYDTTLQPGYYTTPVREGDYVHNLEHGYIVILYARRRAPPETVADLHGLLPTLPPGKYGTVKVIVAPHDRVNRDIVALAWNRELPLDRYDPMQLRAFYLAYVDRGPEDAP